LFRDLARNRQACLLYAAVSLVIKAYREWAIDGKPRRRRTVMSASTETELKFQLDPHSFQKLLADPAYFSDQSVARDQVSTYFDTVRHALQRAGLSLRIRRIGDRRIQTVKTESAETANLFVRSEWERDVAGDTPEIDGLTEALSNAMNEAGEDGIVPLFSIRVTRTAVVLTRAGSRIEMVADRGAITADGRKDAICEIELELLEGDPAQLFSIAREIALYVPLKLGTRSKSARGYALLANRSREAIKADPVRLIADMPVAEAFTAIMNACLHHFRLNEDELERTGAVEPLHQARVALRRLRSALSVFRPMIKGTDLDRLKTELTWLSSLFGDVRNVDVMIDRVHDVQALRTLHAARRERYDNLSKALASPRTRMLMIDLAEWVSTGRWRNDDDVSDIRDLPVSVYSAKVLDKLRRRIKKRSHELAGVGEEARHEVRILAKKLRYSGEFFASLYQTAKGRRRHEIFLKTIEKVQSALGNLNDLSTGRALLIELGIADGDALLSRTGKHKPSRLVAKAQHSLDDLIEAKRFWR
jgi:inorganic triphosphatase YgiF